MRPAPYLIIGLSIAAAGCRGGSISATLVAGDTVEATLSATATSCPIGKGWLLEGIDSVLTMLIWLPTDSPATWAPISSGPGDRPRVVVQRVSRASINTWLADSGHVTVREALRGLGGSFDVFGGSQRVRGTFQAPRAERDTSACVPRPRPGG